MAVTTTLELVTYYQNLLIMQYLGKPKASAMVGSFSSMAIMPQTSVQQITFSAAPTSGTFVLSYNNINSSSINWNDSASTIQSNLRNIAGLSNITIAGSIASLLLTITFAGVIPPSLSLLVNSNSLLISSTPVTISIVETDETLPLAVQDGFNLINGTTIAVGTQLDFLGKYVGVTRTGNGFTQPITLNDSDFLQLIRMAISKNSSGSSLATIQSFLNMFFPNEIFVFDYQNMTMSYVISQNVGSQDLVQLFITEGLLPVPMAVQVTVLYPPTAKLLSFVTYENPTLSGNQAGPNTYESYSFDSHWLTYGDVITP